jgi:TRAP-type mannitol/chloroaromatic compound transport system permease small subunit
LVEFFNLIEFFGVAALFGWLTYAGFMHEEEIPLGRNKAEAKRNRFTINNLFIIAFVLLAISYVTDYLLHHLTISQGMTITVSRDGMVLSTFFTFVAGVFVLALPIWYVQDLLRKGTTLSDIHPAPTNYTLRHCLFAVICSGFIWSLGQPSHIIYYTLLAAGSLPYIGAILGIAYWRKKRKKSEERKRKRLLLLSTVLYVLPFLVLAIAVAVFYSYPTIP